jgi:hypothetical protein
MKYYKFLTKAALGPYSDFNFKPYLPKGGEPGKWLPKIASEIEECETGYHACATKDIDKWINERMFEVEFRGKVEKYSEKVAGVEMRLVREFHRWNYDRYCGCACRPGPTNILGHANGPCKRK